MALLGVVTGEEGFTESELVSSGANRSASLQRIRIATVAVEASSGESNNQAFGFMY